nr:MAG TPA: hypothetical protein [Caudoviricetes sp.]
MSWQMLSFGYSTSGQRPSPIRKYTHHPAFLSAE